MRKRVALFLVLAIGYRLSQASQTDKNLKVDLDLVLVTASVTDDGNRFVPDLKRQQFQIWEDKVEQQIKYFATETAPATVGIIFDMSRSMTRKIEVARQAAVTFLQTGTPEDEYFLIEFNDKPWLAEDFTTDIDRLRSRLMLVPPDGSTAMSDAVYMGLEKVRRGRNPKKALLLITDGEDNHSRYHLWDIRKLARESDVQIYGIDLGRGLIGDLSEITGGRTVRISVDDLERICMNIADELKHQYVLGYVSTNPNRDGKWRKIRVKANEVETRLHIRTRDGYYAGK